MRSPCRGLSEKAYGSFIGSVGHQWPKLLGEGSVGLTSGVRLGEGDKGSVMSGGIRQNIVQDLI